MIPRQPPQPSLFPREPRTRGDDPGGFSKAVAAGTVSPAPAGMIPNRSIADNMDVSEPRTRGDDPELLDRVDAVLE